MNLRIFTAALAVTGIATLTVAAPADAAQKPKLPAACVDVLARADALATSHETVSRLARQFTLAAAPIANSLGAATPPEQWLALTKPYTDGLTALSSALFMGRSAIGNYRMAAARCRASMR
jgi:hypothetical protein